MGKIYEQMQLAIEQAISHMLSWEIVLRKDFDNGDILAIRQGTLDGIQLWFVVLQTKKENMPHEEAAEEKWGDKVLASIVSDDQGLVIWVYDSVELLMSELSVMFGLFQGQPIEET